MNRFRTATGIRICFCRYALRLRPRNGALHDAIGLDRILLGTDYPYEDPEECIEFIEGLPLSAQEKEKIYSVNASQIGVIP